MDLSTISNMASKPETAIWQRTIVPDPGNLSPEAARALLKLAFTEEDDRAMDGLALKAQAGTLTPEENRLLDGYRHVAWLLGLLKSKARLSLQRAGGPS